MAPDRYETKYYRKDWMSDEQWACACLFADLFGGFHHLSGDVKANGDGVELNQLTSGLSTTDFDELTRLVFLAHDRRIRVSVLPSAPRRLRLVAHQRPLREGNMAARHPTIETALAQHRRFWPEKEVVA